MRWKSNEREEQKQIARNEPSAGAHARLDIRPILIAAAISLLYRVRPADLMAIDGKHAPAIAAPAEIRARNRSRAAKPTAKTVAPKLSFYHPGDRGSEGNGECGAPGHAKAQWMLKIYKRFRHQLIPFGFIRIFEHFCATIKFPHLRRCIAEQLEALSASRARQRRSELRGTALRLQCGCSIPQLNCGKKLKELALHCFTRTTWRVAKERALFPFGANSWKCLKTGENTWQRRCTIHLILKAVLRVCRAFKLFSQRLDV